MTTQQKWALSLGVFILGIAVYSWWGGRWGAPSLPLWSKSQSCSSDYSHLYTAGEPVEVRIVFGYKDARPARFVGDRYERNFIIQKLTELGFERDETNDDKFAWRDSFDNENRQLNLTLVHSSVGPDDVENRKNPLQKWRSNYARDTYAEGLRDADVVIYVGHSRVGGGPDFSPPVILKNGKINFSWYRKRRPGYKDTLTALRATKTKPKVLGLLSCTSTQHFENALQVEAPNTKIISSNVLLYYMDSLENLADLLQKTVSPPCQHESQALSGQNQKSLRRG